MTLLFAPDRLDEDEIAVLIGIAIGLFVGVVLAIAIVKTFSR